MRTDIVIIGGGIVGLAIAHRLTRTGAEVCVIDAGEPGGSTTRAAAGMLCPGFELSHVAGPAQAMFHEFAMASLQAWKPLADDLAAVTGEDIDLRLDGALGLAAGAEEELPLRALNDRLAGFGRPARWLDRAGLDGVQPGLAEKYKAAMFLPDEGQVDPRKAASALARAIEARGGTILSRDAVVSMEREGGAIRSVTTRAGRQVSAGQVVLSAGLAARDFWQEEGAVPLFSIKGQALSLSAAPGHGLSRVVRTKGTYICPKAGDRIILGATEEEHVETLDTDDAHIRGLHRRAAVIAPVLEAATLSEQWAGLRPTLPDRLPVIGRSHAAENLVYAFGHHRNGILLAPQTGVLVERLLDGGEGEALMAPTRFMRG